MGFTAIRLSRRVVQLLPVAAITTFGLTFAELPWHLSAVAQAPQNSATSPNPEIRVGVIQRFGRNPDTQLTLEPLTGDQLTLRFETGGQAQTLTTNQVRMEVAMVPLPAPELREWLVLSSHRSFESAEESAQQWRDRGIEAEIAQPDGWEVWADRSTYSTPTLRRLLLEDLQAAGHNQVYLDSRTVDAEPRAAFIANGFRYNRDRVTITSANRRIRVQSTDANTPTRLYGGDLNLQPNAYGTYTLVNTVPMETYLRGVVPHEIGLSAPAPTIEAQAVLARTYALRNLRRFEIDNYELCADTQCQVYWGLGGAATASDRAIAATQHQVLTYQDELIDALYSSTTGGVTAPFSAVWNGPDRPYLQAVVDSVQGSWNLSQRPLSNEQNFRSFINLDTGFNEDDWDTFRWRRSQTLAELTQDFKTYLNNRQHPLAGFNQIQRIEVTDRAEAGRVQELTVYTDLGPVPLEKDEIVRALWPPRSLLFYVEPTYGAPAPGSTEPTLTGYAFVGGGFGHGVGMSQTGAYRLGALGWNHSRILQFYYPNTTLRPLGPDITFWRDPLTAAADAEAGSDAAANAEADN
jgi:SpoIID/LytB domain protein